MTSTFNPLFSAASKEVVTATSSASLSIKNDLAAGKRAAKRSYTTPDMALTENGGVAYASTGSKVLDMYSKGGAYRGKSDTEILDLIRPALKEEPALFGACLFYLRDITKGQGERNFFRVALKYIATTAPSTAVKLIPLIPEYGRWDDLWAFQGTEVLDKALSYWADTITAEYAALTLNPLQPISLAAKWAPSEKAGNASRSQWSIFHGYIGNPRKYRKVISALRKRLAIVESPMCAKEWGSIDYSKVPSRASLLYRGAFKKQDGERYQRFIDSLKGKPKEVLRKSLKAGTLYPYELVSGYLDGGVPHDDTVDALWEALPDFLEGRHKNALAVVDVSGSMTSPKIGTVSPMAIAISLGLYLADNASGIWANKFITFSAIPQFIQVRGKTLHDKVNNMSRAKWDMNTDFNTVFDVILDLAVKHKLGQEDLPQTIFVLSDMEFDASCTGRTNFQQIHAKFNAAGYAAPNFVFWRVKAGDTSPVMFNEYGTALISGFSANGFRQVLGEPKSLDELQAEDVMTAESSMREVLESERYQQVREAFI